MLTDVFLLVLLGSLTIAAIVTTTAVRKRRRRDRLDTRSILLDSDLSTLRERQAKLAEALPPARRSPTSLPVGVGAA